jgi:hypothetical protein
MQAMQCLGIPLTQIDECLYVYRRKEETMTAFSLMIGPTLASAAVSPGLIWSTVLVWMAVAFVLATLVAVVAQQARPQLHVYRVRASGTRCMPLRVCAVCAR